MKTDIHTYILYSLCRSHDIMLNATAAKMSDRGGCSKSSLWRDKVYTFFFDIKVGLPKFDKVSSLHSMYLSVHAGCCFWLPFS